MYTVHSAYTHFVSSIINIDSGGRLCLLCINAKTITSLLDCNKCFPYSIFCRPANMNSSSNKSFSYIVTKTSRSGNDDICQLMGSDLPARVGHVLLRAKIWIISLEAAVCHKWSGCERRDVRRFITIRLLHVYLRNRRLDTKRKKKQSPLKLAVAYWNFSHGYTIIMLIVILNNNNDNNKTDQIKRGKKQLEKNTDIAQMM